LRRRESLLRTKREGAGDCRCTTASAWKRERAPGSRYEILDLPDNESAAAVAVTASAGGGATVKTVVLLTPEEVDAATQRSLEYRPPGG
jgi:hypothetical protein